MTLPIFQIHWQKVQMKLNSSRNTLETMTLRSYISTRAMNHDLLNTAHPWIVITSQNKKELGIQSWYLILEFYTSDSKGQLISEIILGKNQGFRDLGLTWLVSLQIWEKKIFRKNIAPIPLVKIWGTWYNWLIRVNWG